MINVQQSNAEVASVQSSKLPGQSSTVSPKQPTSPATVASDTASSIPASPPTSVTVFSAAGGGTETPTTVREVPPPSSRVRELLLDLTADNKAIASKHRLQPKTRISVLQASDISFQPNWCSLFLQLKCLFSAVLTFVPVEVLVTRVSGIHLGIGL